MTNHARRERSALADLLEQVGPDAPTRCDGWATRDLAAHLVLRDRRLDAAPGILGGPLAAHAERVRRSLAAGDYRELVAQVRGGPPPWNPLSLPALDRAVNTLEYFVHHEDVRRARPAWQPRVLDPGLESALWGALRSGSRFLMRRSPVGVVLQDLGGRRVTARAGSPAVTLRGAPGELVLVAYGRGRVARFAADGDPEPVLAARLGP